MWRTLERLEGIGVVSVSMDGQILRCNDAFGVILSDDKVHLVGRNIVDLTVPEDRARSRESLLKLSSGEVGHIRAIQCYLSKSGSETCCRVFKMRIQGSGDDQLLYWAYEFEKNDSDTKRVEKLETLLEKFLAIAYRSNGHGVDIKMINSDNSQSAKADRGGQAVIQNDNKTVIVAVVIMIGLVVVGTLALVLGGGVSLRHGDSEVEIDGE